MAQRQLADDERMRYHLPAIEQHRKALVAAAQMVDPDRGIHQDHAALIRRRGGAFKSGWVPPSRASRYALSRSMSAFSASLTRAEVSRNSVSSRARSSRSSSSATVVRMS